MLLILGIVTHLQRHVMGELVGYKENSIGMAVVQRIVDMFSPEVQWSQRLWRPSAIDALKHCLDLIEGEAREGAKAYAVKEARKRIENDLFIPRKERGGILKSLTLKPEKMIRGSVAEARLQCVCAELEDRYAGWVQQFVDALDDTTDVKSSTVDGSSLAWQIAAFLRSEGMSDKWIAKFHYYHLRFNPEPMSLSETIKQARQVLSTGSGWTFFVPLKVRRSFNVQAPPLLSKREFELRFAEALPGVEVPKNRGGLEISVDTIDKYAAIDEVQFVMQRVIDRHRASHSKRRLAFDSHAWVSPGAWDTELAVDVAPKVRVLELDALGGGQMFGRASDELEAALDLLTAADRTSSRAATIASWAVLETLFADESDYGELAIVADRAADVLTCLYVQSTFTDIARGHSRAGKDSLAEQLRSCSGDAEAALLIEQALPSHPMSVNATLGELARQRATGMSPAEVESVRSQLSAVLRRLYDMRNQVVHAGRMAPFGLDRTYEESTVLLSALMDELLRQHRIAKRSTREVAGRASWLLERVSSERATPASLAQIGDSRVRAG